MTYREFAPQLMLLHLSDIHFGPRHRFDPPPTPTGDTPKRIGYPTLLDKLREDWNEFDAGCPVIVCITGDLTTTASDTEFGEAVRFVKEISNWQAFGQQLTLNRVFTVPGNHDILWTGRDEVARMKSWVDFHNEAFNTTYTKQQHRQCVKVFDRFDDIGAIVLTVNSAMHVQQGVADEARGHIDLDQLRDVQEALTSVPVDHLNRAIKIAILHHHPVLIPAMAEPGRGYDAVHNSGRLLTLLRKFGFHLLLHGHKHNPFIFTDDTRGAFGQVDAQPLLIVAGGSAGSIDLPDGPKKGNTYNRILLKWHPAAIQSRTLIQTRKLSVYDTDGSERLPHYWKWETLDDDDRSFYGKRRLPLPIGAKLRRFDERVDAHGDAERHQTYKRLRGNMPVLEVLPSLEPKQAYEVRLWVVRHERAYSEAPVQVTWEAGKQFEVVTVNVDADPNFTASLSYWGPMLVQAQLTFADGAEERVHLYARMPTSYPNAEDCL